MSDNLNKTSRQPWSEYRELLYRFILKRINDPDIAEDLIQEVLTKAYEQLGRLKDEDKLISWLYRITRNTIIDHYRKQKAGKKSDEPIADIYAEDEEKIAQDLACCLKPFIKELPVEYRQAITLFDLDGLKLKQVAEQQGLSVSGVKSRVQRGRKMLRTMFTECCEIEHDRRGGVIDYESPKGCNC